MSHSVAIQSRCMLVRPTKVVLIPLGQSTDILTRVDVKRKAFDFFAMPVVVVAGQGIIAYVTEWKSHQYTSNLHLISNTMKTSTRNIVKQEQKKRAKNGEEMSIVHAHHH